MSTATATVERVTGRLEATWLGWFGFSLATGTILVLSLSLGCLIAFVLLDALLQLPQLVLAGLFGTWVLLTGAAIVGLVFHVRRTQRTLAATARRVEMAFPSLGSHLINVVQFAEGEHDGSHSFQRAALERAAAAVSSVPFEKAAAGETRWGRLRLGMQTARDCIEAAGLLLVIVGFGLLMRSMLPHWDSSLNRLFQPWHFVPSVGTVEIVEVTPGDADVLLGSTPTVTVAIDNPSQTPYAATLFVTRTGTPEAAVVMQASPNQQTFAAVLPQVLEPLRYRLQVGDSQTRVFTLGVRQKPSLAEVEVTYRYPAYTGRRPETVTQEHGDLKALQYTTAELTIRSATPVSGGHLLVDGQQITARPGNDSFTLHAALVLEGNTTYTIHLRTDGGQTDDAPRVNQIQVVPDTPPAVQVVQPARESSAPAGTAVPVLVRAFDDFGLGQVRVEMKRGDEAVQVLAAASTFAEPTHSLLNHQLLLEKGKVKPGDVIQVRAVARDRRNLEVTGSGSKPGLSPQETATAWQTIQVVAADAKAGGDLAQLDGIRAVLWKVLQQQIKARVTAAQMLREDAEVKSLAAEVHGGQVEVQKATLAVAEAIEAKADVDRLTIKRAASKLALGDMVAAVKQADAVCQVGDRAGLPGPVATLTATQDRVIDTLRRLLNEVRRDMTDTLAEMDKRPGGDLPNDVKDKLRELKDKLQDFLKQQKKVIEASEALAKMPVEDFTDKEQKLLEALAATEDDWSRFVTEKHDDFAKLPEQDFSNPSLLQELVEVQTELKMAKDALTKKAADIAVPLEQLGAEMAKEITTNIEKWLPDTPDRERWSQEEPLTDDMKEAPMAELPKELEDLIGELMEEEEALFDEMEDVASRWADSLDKGAGWDAADGPISNMSAKGVTGNRLPNTNEIGGRSGEGRQGKASGEFVGDSAVGKGGRKTPSRLTQDPHVKGDIKDSSKDPVGGATGGGKQSGEGGEGMEGPVPSRPQTPTQRLAGKQADLRNKAEGIDLQMKVMRYHHTDLSRMLDQMAAVEADLRSGRYLNALRRRDVLLDGLGQVRTYLSGEVAVRQDQTSSLPTDIQKEMLGSMREASPAGWEQLNQQYFEKLTGGSSKPPAPR